MAFQLTRRVPARLSSCLAKPWSATVGGAKHQSSLSAATVPRPRPVLCYEAEEEEELVPDLLHLDEPSALVLPQLPTTTTPVTAVHSRQKGLEQLFTAWETDDIRDPHAPLCITDVGVVERQHERWTAHLPKVAPYYAIKCNPDPQILTALAEAGAGFDSATSHEIELALNAGAKGSDIIFANPIKTVGDIKYARQAGVHKMTFDNADEVRKIKEHFPDASLVLRLLVDDGASVMRFGSKFGAPEQHVKSLLLLCKELDMKVLGVSFHIGSGCYDTSLHRAAIARARLAFDLAADVGLPPMKMVDIGGGFPGCATPHEREGKVPAFEEFAEAIRDAFDTEFPAAQYPSLERIAEPGRYFSTACATIFTSVTGKRDMTGVEAADIGAAEKTFLYYLNDGIYGSFNCIMFDHVVLDPIPMTDFFEKRHGSDLEGDSTGTFFGPTCDSMDVLCEGKRGRELSVGEHVVFDMMGAYTTAAGSRFNGCKLPEKLYMRSSRV